MYIVQLMHSVGQQTVNIGQRRVDDKTELETEQNYCKTFVEMQNDKDNFGKSKRAYV